MNPMADNEIRAAALEAIAVRGMHDYYLLSTAFAHLAVQTMPPCRRGDVMSWWGDA